MTSLGARCRGTPWLVFALVFAWKLVLLALSAQPVPSNDAFFYDGAVVHQLLHGGYYNASLAQALPISGTQVFSAYPPLYQGFLWVWMSVFGTSALVAMALHLALFGGYALVVYRILKRLETPIWCMNLAGGFLLLLTFHDRPDSLAHLLGMLAVLSLMGSRRVFNQGEADSRRRRAEGWMVVFVVLTLCTSLQIGAFYLLWLWLGIAVTNLAGKERLPVRALAATVLVPVALMAAVRFGFSSWWTGFMEHARQTPSWTGLRAPNLAELLKVGRTAPGICLVAVFLPWSWFKQHNDIAHANYARHEYVLVPALVAALAVVAACLFALTANMVFIADYLQPVIVACYLAFCGTLFAGQRWLRAQVLCLCLVLVLGSVRAVGMSTWGLACAADVGYRTAMLRVDGELAMLQAGSKAVLSSAFLYEASKHGDLTLIHSDWMHPAKQVPPVTDLQSLIALRPREMIFTQFDYYRRHRAVLEGLKGEPSLLEMKVTDTAKFRPPDAYPSLQRVVQHISWAPVIVELSWRQ